VSRQRVHSWTRLTAWPVTARIGCTVANNLHANLSTNVPVPLCLCLWGCFSTTVSDVVEHSELDLDMQKLEAAADEFDFATAYAEYSEGGERWEETWKTWCWNEWPFESCELPVAALLVQCRFHKHGRAPSSFPPQTAAVERCRVAPVSRSKATRIFLRLYRNLRRARASRERGNFQLVILFLAALQLRPLPRVYVCQDLNYNAVPFADVPCPISSDSHKWPTVVAHVWWARAGFWIRS